jgi:Dullard-like phosphatase family protein
VLGYNRYKKDLDTTPDSSSKDSSQEYTQKGVKKTIEISSSEKRRSLLNQSTETIGDDADITVSYEDFPHSPATSVLKDATIFDKNGMNKKKSSFGDRKRAASPKDYTNFDKHKDQRKSRLHKNKSIVSVDKKPFKNYEHYPTYLGYYFRELFKSTVKELHSQNKINNVDQYLDDKLYESNVDLPELTDKIIDDNKTHVTQSMQGLYYMNTVAKTDAYKHLKKTLPPTNKKKLAIFDMDETLIHCIPDREPQSDTGSSRNKETDVMLKFQCSDGVDTLPVNIRPYIIECLLQVKKWYQVIVFTASKKNYADTILDFIDPNKDLIEARCYRDSCYITEEHVYIKDLRIFEDQWSLKDIVLIDNAVHSFGFQVNNGIPMLPFYDDKNDRDMIYVTHLLEDLATQPDVRPMIRGRFWINKLKEPLI